MSRFFSALLRHEEITDGYEGPDRRMSTLVGETDTRDPSRPATYRSVNLMVAKGPLIPFDGSDARTAEQYRILRTKILLHAARPKMIAISSASSGDGKTVTAINLAGTLALKADANVLLVDADLRKGNVASLLGIPDSPGLAEVLRDTCTLDDAIVQIEDIPNLTVLPSGQPASNPAELLDSVQWKRTATTLRAHFSFVIIDTTPVTAVADFQLVQQASDAVMLVLRPDHTRRSQFQTALDAIRKDKLLGTLLNAIPDSFLSRSKENDYYYVNKDQEPI